MSSDRDRGATLIESVFAIGLLLIALSTIGNMLNQQLKAQSSNLTRTNAITLAERELEDLRSLDYNDIASRSSSQMFGSITYAVSTSVVADQPAANMKTIATTVSWTDAGGAQSYVTNAIYTAIKR